MTENHEENLLNRADQQRSSTSENWLQVGHDTHVDYDIIAEKFLQANASKSKDMNSFESDYPYLKEFNASFGNEKVIESDFQFLDTYHCAPESPSPFLPLQLVFECEAIPDK